MPGAGFTLLIGLAPAPPGIVEAVREIEVDTAVSEASVLRLRLAIAQTAIGDWTVLEQDLFRPLAPVSIRVTNALGIPEALINGYVSTQQARYSLQPGESVLDVVGMDATMLMNLQEKSTPWLNMPDSVIAAAIYGQYGLIPKVQPTPPLMVEPEGSTAQRGTDIRFLRRLAERNGFDAYVLPEPLTGLDVGYFQPPQLVGLPQAVLNVNMGTETNVTDFEVTYEMARPTTAVGAEIDVSNKVVQAAVAPASTQPPQGLEPTLTRVLPPPVVRPADTGLMRTGEMQPMLQGIADRSSFAIAASGVVDPQVALLRPGGFVNVRGAGRVFNGSYSLTRVSHTIRRGSHTQRFEARRNAVGMTGTELYFGP